MFLHKTQLWVGLTILTLQPSFSGCGCSVHNTENIERMRIRVQQSQRCSALWYATALNLSDRVVHCILHEDLWFNPYKIQVALKLQDQDSRLHFINEFSAVLQENVNAYFHLSGFINKQNYHYWSDMNPMVLQDWPLHSDKVSNYWTLFFLNENGRTVIVSGQCYWEIL